MANVSFSNVVVSGVDIDVFKEESTMKNVAYYNGYQNLDHILKI